MTEVFTVPLFGQLNMDFFVESSSPGEFHPQALMEPDVTVSRHPARITPTAGFKANGLALPLGSSHRWLTKQ